MVQGSFLGVHGDIGINSGFKLEKIMTLSPVAGIRLL